MLAINCSAAETAMPVGIAFRGETRAGITVPALGAAEAGTSFERPHVKVESAELVKLVKPGNVGADDRIKIRRHIRPDLAHCRRRDVHALLSRRRAIGHSWHRPPFRSASDWPLKGRGHREPRPASVP